MALGECLYSVHYVEKVYNSHYYLPHLFHFMDQTLHLIDNICSGIQNFFFVFYETLNSLTSSQVQILDLIISYLIVSYLLRKPSALHHFKSHLTDRF